MVERQLEDVIEVLGQQQGRVSAGPENTHVGRHHGEDRAAAEDISHLKLYASLGTFPPMRAQ